MGTEIQRNAFFSKNYHVIDLNGNGRNGVGSFFQNNQTRRNGQDLDSLMSGMYQNGFSVYDIDKMRQTILKHESTFRSQLQELHRLHRRQRDLMSEIKSEAPRVTVVRIGDALGHSFKSSDLEPNGSLRNSLDGIVRGLPLRNIGLTSGKTGDAHLLGHSDKRRVVEHSGTRDIYFAKSAVSSHSLLGEPQNELLSSTFEASESLLRKKQKLFGVEIYEVNNDSFNAVSNTASTVRRNDSSSSELQNSVSLKQNLEHVGKNLKDDRSSIRLLNSFNGPDQCADVDFEDTKGILPWFLRNHQSNGEPSKGINGSYFMNLDSAQNSSQLFFKKAEIADDSLHRLKEKEEISTQKDTRNVEGEKHEICNKIHSTTKIFGFPIPDTLQNVIAVDSKKEENDPKNQLEMKTLDCATHLRLQIDLNLSLYEEDAPSAPSFPVTIVKIATTEIDMEAPSVNESKSVKPEASKGRSEISYEECDERAADALICITNENDVNDKISEPLEPESMDCLDWFADLVLSQSGKVDTISEGMDDFEFMTLKLEDMKAEYSPMVMNNESDREEAGRTASTCEGSRSGRVRRGRRQRDFKKEIPGLVTLSRHEMKEDLKAFEEIRKGESRKRRSPKKGKGKKRSVSPIIQRCLNEMNLEVGAMEGSLVGWGKKTRRLPRQRCPNLYLPVPVKC